MLSTFTGVVLAQSLHQTHCSELVAAVDCLRCPVPACRRMDAVATVEEGTLEKQVMSSSVDWCELQDLTQGRRCQAQRMQ